MPATFVTEAELRANLQIATLYSSAVVEEVCQSAQDLVNSFLWYDRAPVIGASLSNNVVTLALDIPGRYVTGQSLTVAGCGSTYNGTFTITGTSPNVATGWLPTWRFNSGISYVTYAKVSTDDIWHSVIPYGTITAPDTKTTAYAADPSVREATMMLAVDIWQARQVSQTGGVAVDGSMPNPYRMGNSLMGKIRGLLTSQVAPSSMVG